MSSFLVDQVGTAIQIGATYALLAVGYSVAYSTMNLVNFAHGEVFMVGAVAGYFVLGAIPTHTVAGAVGVFVCAVLIGAAASAVVASSIQRLLYRRLVSRGRFSLVLAALAASMFLQQTMLLVLRTSGSGSSERLMPMGILDTWSWNGLRVTDLSGATLLVAGIAFLVWVLGKTDFGLCMQALAFDRAAAARVPIPAARITAAAFAMGGALAGAAGVVYAAHYTLTPYMGFTPGLKAFLACVLGGRTPFGAAVGGLVIGVIEGLASGWFGSAARDLVTGVALMACLAMFPAGLSKATRLRTI